MQAGYNLSSRTMNLPRLHSALQPQSQPYWASLENREIPFRTRDCKNYEEFKSAIAKIISGTTTVYKQKIDKLIGENEQLFKVKQVVDNTFQIDAVWGLISYHLSDGVKPTAFRNIFSVVSIIWANYIQFLEL